MRQRLFLSVAMTALLASGGVFAQSKPSDSNGKPPAAMESADKPGPDGGASADAGDGTDLQVGHVDPKQAMEDLMDAVSEFREASVALLEQKPGPDREAAIEAAQDALLLTQQAMLMLPPDMRIADVKIRDAKAWPQAMARLDKASRSLEEALKAMKDQPAGEKRDKAVATVQKALGEAQQAMLELPDAGSDEADAAGASGAK